MEFVVHAESISKELSIVRINRLRLSAFKIILQLFPRDTI